jgi:aminoglycoside phosphotransferase (APT) family kinase protein
VTDPVGFATDLAGFLGALYAIDASGGPPAGAHSFYRGSPLDVYDPETRQNIDTLRDDGRRRRRDRGLGGRARRAVAWARRVGARRRDRVEPARRGTVASSR